MARRSSAPRAANAVDSVAKRARLPARKDPYWQPVGPQRGGVSLGYRKPSRGPGSWIVRLIVHKKRVEVRLGSADDPGSASEALNYAQACSKALVEGKRYRDEAARATTPAPVATVQVAIDRYVAARKARDPHNGRDAELRLAKHVLGEDAGMAGRVLSGLDERDWSAWRKGLIGLSPSGVARLINDVRAAMMVAWGEHRRSLRPEWKDNLIEGLKQAVDSSPPPTDQVRDYLPDADVRRLIAASFEADIDFGHLVLALAATGARLSQVSRLTAADVLDGYLWLFPSRKGKPSTRKAGKIRVPVDIGVTNALKAAAQGKAGDELLLMHWRMAQEKGDKAAGLAPRWVNRDRVAWRVSAETTRRWKAALEKAGLPETLTLTALRDASIIRALREGVPLDLVARIHNTSGPIIRQHYALHIHDALDQVARQAVIPMMPVPAAP